MSIALSLGNNLTTGGVFKPAAVNNTSCNNITTFAGLAGGATLNLISTQTASASATISFTSGIDSTYDEYVFKLINIHPSNDGEKMTFQGSTDGGSTYATTIHTAVFDAYQNETASDPSLAIRANQDQQNGTAFQSILENIGNDNDQNGCCELRLYAPSSTTYVKHFISVHNRCNSNEYSVNGYVTGYFNTTSAINAVQFKMSVGNIDDGVIKMYGVKKS